MTGWSVLKLASGLTSVQAVGAVLLLGIAAWLARVLSPPEYATYLQVYFISSHLPMLVGIPLGRALVFFLPRTEAPASLRRRLALLTLGPAVAAAAALMFIPGLLELADRHDAHLSDQRLIAGLTIGLAFTSSAAQQVLLALDGPRLYGLTLVAFPVLIATGLGAARLIDPDGAQLGHALCGLSLAHLAQGALVIGSLLASPRAGDAGRAVTTTAIFRFGAPVLIATLVSIAALRLDLIVVPAVFGGGMGVKSIYFRGAMVVPLLGSLAPTVWRIAAPELSRLHAGGQIETMTSLWRESISTIALLSIPGAGLAFALAPDLLGLVFGDLYRASAAVFRWYALFLIAGVIQPSVLLECTGHARQSVYVSVATFVFVGAAMPACVHLHAWAGYEPWLGAASAVVLGRFASWGVGGYLVARRLPVPPRALCDWAFMARLVVLTAASVAVVIHLSEPITLPGFRIIFVSAGFALCFLLALGLGFLSRRQLALTLGLGP